MTARVERNHEPEFTEVRLRSPAGITEIVWAVAFEEGVYRLNNIPFFAYGVSAHDIVEAVPDDDGVLGFTRVLRPSGNRTLRIVFKEEIDASHPLLRQLNELGVGCEGATSLLVALNVPPKVDLAAVANLLDGSGQLEIWEYANPTWEQVRSGGYEPTTG